MHQSTYVEEILKHFNMDDAHPLNIPMVVRYPVRPQQDNEEIVGPKVPYLNSNWCFIVFTLMYQTKLCILSELLGEIQLITNAMTLKWHQTYFSIPY